MNTCAPSVTNTKATPHNGEAPAHVLNVENSEPLQVAYSSALRCNYKNKVKQSAVTAKYRLHKTPARAGYTAHKCGRALVTASAESPESGKPETENREPPAFL